MSRKRRRKRSPGGGRESAPTTGDAGSRPAKAEDRAQRGAKPSATDPSPFPPLAASVGRGLRAAGSTPVALAVAFLSLLVTTGVLVTMDVEATPTLLTQVMAVFPAHLFVDVPAAFTVADPGRILLSLSGVAVIRAVTWALLIGLLGGAVEGRTDLRETLRRLPRTGVTLMAIDLVGVGLVFVVLQVGPGILGQFSLFLIAAMIYFLAFVPVAAVMGDEPLRGAFRLGFRATRLPGTRHLTLVLVYFMVLYAASAASFDPLAPATPSVLTWGVGLAATFVHLGMLGTLVYRWLAVRDRVLEQSGRRGRSGW